MNHASDLSVAPPIRYSRIVPGIPVSPSSNQQFGISNGLTFSSANYGHGVGFVPLRGGYLKAQQFYRGFVARGKDDLVRMLSRATEMASNREAQSNKVFQDGAGNCSFTSNFYFFMSRHSSPRLASQPAPGFPAVFSTFSAGVGIRIAFIITSTAWGSATRSIIQIWTQHHAHLGPPAAGLFRSPDIVVGALGRSILPVIVRRRDRGRNT